MAIRKTTWLTLDDIEDFFIAACETNHDIPNRLADPAVPLVIDPFQATNRFIRTFADWDQLGACLDHLVTLHRGMQPPGGISDAD